MEETKLKVNVTLWMVAVRRKLAETTNEVHRAFLHDMYVELARRLPA